MVKTHAISGSELCVAIAGAREAQIRNVDEKLKKIQGEYPGKVFQLFNADMVAGEKHLFYAAVNAVGAQSGGYAISRNLEVETLLYASCQDQISKGLRILGLTQKTRRVAVLVFSDNKDEAKRVAQMITESIGEPDDGVLDVSPEKYESLKKAYGVSEVSIKTVGSNPYDALTSLIIEKGALLPILR